MNSFFFDNLHHRERESEGELERELERVREKDKQRQRERGTRGKGKGKGKADRQDENLGRAASKVQMKSQSLGDASVPLTDRVYLSVTFKASGLTICFFFSKHNTLSEMLHKLATASGLEKAAFGSLADSTICSQYGLVLYSDSQLPEWQDWDRSQPLIHYFPDDEEKESENSLLARHHNEVEDVVVTPAPLSLIQQAQNRFQIPPEGKRRKQEQNSASPTVSSSASPSTPPPVTVSTANSAYGKFKKYEKVNYILQSGKTDVVEAEIKQIHFENGPDEIYYTIYIPSLSKEKQTIEGRLAPIDDSDDSTVCGLLTDSHQPTPATAQ